MQKCHPVYLQPGTNVTLFWLSYAVLTDFFSGILSDIPFVFIHIPASNRINFFSFHFSVKKTHSGLYAESGLDLYSQFRGLQK